MSTGIRQYFTVVERE